MEFTKAPSSTQVHVADLTPENTFVSQAFVSAVPTAPRAFWHALEAVPVLQGRVRMAFTSRPLHAPCPLVVTNQLLRQANTEMALCKLFAIKACWRWPSSAFSQNHIGVDDAEVYVEPQKVAPPFFAWPPDLVALPKLVAQINTPHVLWYKSRGSGRGIPSPASPQSPSLASPSCLPGPMPTMPGAELVDKQLTILASLVMVATRLPCWHW